MTVAEGSRRTSARGGSRREGRERGDGLRTCLGCNQAREPGLLLRLVCTPEHQVHVDVRGKGGGRGAWMCPRRACFLEAVKRRRIGRALRVEGLVIEPDALLTDAAAALRGRLDYMVALSQKAGRVISGSDAVERAVAGGETVAVLLAVDASPATAEKAKGWSRAAGVPALQLPHSVEELGRLLGKPPRAVVALRPGELARAVLREVERLSEVTGDPVRK